MNIWSVRLLCAALLICSGTIALAIASLGSSHSGANSVAAAVLIVGTVFFFGLWYSPPRRNDLKPKDSSSPFENDA